MVGLGLVSEALESCSVPEECVDSDVHTGNIHLSCVNITAADCEQVVMHR